MGRLHPNVLKIRKQARMRRAYLKGYDMGTMIRVQRKVGKGDIPEDQLGYFNYRARANTFWDPYLEAKFPSRGMVGKARADALEKSKRVEIMATLAEWSKLVLEEMNVVVKRGEITRTLIRFFWSSDEHLCFFTKEDYLDMSISKSMEYCGEGARERAYFALDNNRIDWMERVSLSSLTAPDAPSG